MRVKIAVPEEHVSPEVVDAALESVTRLDRQLVEAGQVPPWSASTGVKWRPENMGDEHFDNAAIVLGRGWGDCDDLAPWHAASLRASGADPGAVARVVPSGPTTYHAVVQRSDGSIDDPSKEAGMSSGSKHVVGGEEHPYSGALLPTCGPLEACAGPAYAVRRVGALWQARCDAPMVGSRMVHVRSYWRHGRKHRCHGLVPYSLASIAMHPDPHVALHQAVMGAIATGVAAPIDVAKMHSFLRGSR